MRKFEFKYVKEFFCLRGGSDVELYGDKLFISGYITDKKGEPYDLYYIDLKNNERITLLPSYYKYGMDSNKQYKEKYQEESLIPAIGIKGWFDFLGDEIFYVWEGDLKIINLNIDKRELTFMGIKTAGYVKPFDSENPIKMKNLKEKYLKKDFEGIQKARRQFSYVKNVFTSSRFFLVIYEDAVRRGEVADYRLQLYSLKGELLKELALPGRPDQKMCFDKENQVLYSLAHKPGESSVYNILKYKMELPKVGI
jgi:hypothetical protein